MQSHMTLAGDPVNHSGKVTPRLCHKEAPNTRRFREIKSPSHFNLMIQLFGIQPPRNVHHSHILASSSPSFPHLPLDPCCPVATPIVQVSTALRIVLASPLARRKAFACFLLAFLQDLLNDFNVYMCAKLVVEFLL
jgi:hypothetical protein